MDLTADQIEELENETVLLCQEMIRIPSVNYGEGKGDEKAMAEYVAAKLSEVGISSELVETAPNRVNVVAKFEGRDPSRPGLVLHGHIDVVPANAEDWSVDPFSGVIKVCNQFAQIAKQSEYIAGIEARGFIFASAVAALTNKGFIPIRKSGKLPGKVISKMYDLEYGKSSLEIHTDLIPAGGRVLLIDDVLATGGTAIAAIDLLKMAELNPVCNAFLLEIPALGGRSRIAKAHPDIKIATILAE